MDFVTYLSRRVLLGSPDNAGILPRSLDVVFNSISGRHLSGKCALMPHLFRDVLAMTPNTANKLQKIKDGVMKMATGEVSLRSTFRNRSFI